MPRPSSSTLQSNLVLLKTPSNDLFNDYSIMLDFQFERFKEFMFDNHIQTVENKLKIAKSRSQKPTHKYRIYILYNVDDTALVLYDMCESVVRNIERSFNTVGSLEFNEIHPKDAITIFIFEDSDLISVYDIGIKHLVELSYCFSNENILSKSLIRKSCYSDPRRHDN